MYNLPGSFDLMSATVRSNHRCPRLQGPLELDGRPALSSGWEMRPDHWVPPERGSV